MCSEHTIAEGGDTNFFMGVKMYNVLKYVFWSSIYYDNRCCVKISAKNSAREFETTLMNSLNCWIKWLCKFENLGMTAKKDCNVQCAPILSHATNTVSLLRHSYMRG